MPGLDVLPLSVSLDSLGDSNQVLLEQGNNHQVNKTMFRVRIYYLFPDSYIMRPEDKI